MPIGFMAGVRFGLIRFRLADIGALSTCGGRRRAKGEKASPLAIPGLWRMPTAGTAPGCGLSFTGREPHAIPGVTLPGAVILTAHRLQPPLRPARQTALGWAMKGSDACGAPCRCESVLGLKKNNH
jgi:hypothetical protein